MDKKEFIEQMEQIATMGNKSVTVSLQDFTKIIDYAKESNNNDNSKLRQFVIAQSGYGMNGCKLCDSQWMRSPNTEKHDHKKDCQAYPNT